MLAAMEFEDKHRPALESLLEPGEALEGVCAASQQLGLFKGRVLAIGVTDRRLILQPLDRRGEPTGDVESLHPGDVVSADAGGASGGWASPAAAVADRVAVKLKLETAAGDKLRFAMMRGGSKLGGGESQQRGVAALAAWLERAGARPG
jgi:hypothetical protein